MLRWSQQAQTQFRFILTASPSGYTLAEIAENASVKCKLKGGGAACLGPKNEFRFFMEEFSMSPTPPKHSAKQPSSNHLSSQLSLYSFAAAAAGVSVLALAIPAEGEVVITRKTMPIPLPERCVGISLANSGIDDFTITLSYFVSGASTRPTLSLRVDNAPDGRGVVGIYRLSRLGSS